MSQPPPQPASSIFGDVTSWMKRIFNSIVVVSSTHQPHHDANNDQHHKEHDNNLISSPDLKHRGIRSFEEDRPSKRARISNESIKHYGDVSGSIIAPSASSPTKDLYGTEPSSQSTLIKSPPTQSDHPQKVNEYEGKILEEASTSNIMIMEEKIQDDNGVISSDEIWYEAEEWHETIKDGIKCVTGLSKSTQKKPPPRNDDPRIIIDDECKRNNEVPSPDLEEKKDNFNKIHEEGQTLVMKNAPSPSTRPYTPPTVATSVDFKDKKKEGANPPPAVHISPDGSCTLHAVAAGTMLADDVTYPVPLTITPPAAVVVPVAARHVSGGIPVNAASNDDGDDKEEDRKLPARRENEEQKQGDVSRKKTIKTFTSVAKVQLSHAAAAAAAAVPRASNVSIGILHRRRNQAPCKSVQRKHKGQKQPDDGVLYGTATAAAASPVEVLLPSVAAATSSSTANTVIFPRRRKIPARKSAPDFRGNPSARRNYLIRQRFFARERTESTPISLFQSFPNEILLLICSYYQGDYSVLSSLSQSCSGFHTVLKENDYLWKIPDPKHKYYSSFEVKNRTYKTWHYRDEEEDDDDDESNDGRSRDVVRFDKCERITVVTCREMAGRINRLNALESEQWNPHGINAVLDELGKDEFESFLQALSANSYFYVRFRFQDDEALMAYALLLEANVVHVCEKLLKMHYSTSMYAFYEHPFAPPLQRVYHMLENVQFQDALRSPYELLWGVDDAIHPRYNRDEIIKSRYYRAIRRIAYRGGLCEINKELADHIWYLFMSFAIKIMRGIRESYEEIPGEVSFSITKSMIEQQVKALGLPYQVAYVHKLEGDEDEDDEMISWSPSSDNDDSDDDDEPLIFDPDDEDSHEPNETH